MFSCRNSVLTLVAYLWWASGCMVQGLCCAGRELAERPPLPRKCGRQSRGRRYRTCCFCCRFIDRVRPQLVISVPPIATPGALLFMLAVVLFGIMLIWRSVLFVLCLAEVHRFWYGRIGNHLGFIWKLFLLVLVTATSIMPLWFRSDNFHMPMLPTAPFSYNNTHPCKGHTMTNTSEEASCEPTQPEAQAPW